MSEFKLSDGIDKEKIFFINLNKLKGRYDPYYYKKEFDIIEEKLSKIEYTIFKNATNKIFSGITPKSKGDSYTTISDGIAFVRSGNFSQDNIIDFNKLNYIKYEVHNKTMKSSKLLKNDLLIAIVGATIGKVGIYNYDKEANINQAICAVRFKKEFLSHFVHIYLLTPLGQKIIDRLKRPVARANINLEEIGSIPLPFISVNKQKKIIEYYYKIIKQKRQKEEQAKVLLNSIDDYLLDELGITLPKIDNSLEKRIFEVNLSEVSGGRFDPLKYYSMYLNKIKAILNSKFEIKSLNNFILSSLSGDWGNDDKKIKDFSEYKKCLVIRATEFDNKFNIKIDSSRKKYRFIKKEKLLRLNIEENDILIEKSGGSPNQPVGRVVILTKEIIENNEIGYSNFIHKIKLTKNINSKYIFYYLRVMYNQKVTENMQSQTNGIRNLIMDEFLNIPISIPPIQKQNEIAQHIQNIRDNAKQLNIEAKQDLENAKLEVENMILGQ
jgi:restriction endonuclease S subunit